MTTAQLMLDVLGTFKEFVGDNDVQVQTIQVFLKIANSSSSPSMEDLMKTAGIGMSATSRNIKKLAAGPYQQPGYGLITVELDPHDYRRKIISLSLRGRELMKKLDEAMRPHLVYLTHSRSVNHG